MSSKENLLLECTACNAILEQMQHYTKEELQEKTTILLENKCSQIDYYLNKMLDKPFEEAHELLKSAYFVWDNLGPIRDAARKAFPHAEKLFDTLDKSIQVHKDITHLSKHPARIIRDESLPRFSGSSSD